MLIIQKNKEYLNNFADKILLNLLLFFTSVNISL